MSSTPLIPFRGSYPALPEMSPGKFDSVQRKFWKKLKFVFRSTVGLGGFFSPTPRSPPICIILVREQG